MSHFVGCVYCVKINADTGYNNCDSKLLVCCKVTMNQQTDTGQLAD